MAIADKLTLLAETKQNIRQSIIDKGVDVPDDIPFSAYPDKIAEISGGNGDEWQPHPDWWDIETMVNTGVVPWQAEPLTDVRYGFVVSDSNNTIKLPSGYQFYLSDGAYYTAATTHTWDRTKDKPCADGYKTRAVIVCKSANRDVAISQRAFAYDGIDSLYVYFGDCNVTSLVFSGSYTPSYANKLIQAVKANDRTTYGSAVIATTYGCYNCYNLASLPLFTGATTFGTQIFAYCYSLSNIPVPDSITYFGGSAFQNCYSLLSTRIPSTQTALSNPVFGGCHALQSVIVPQKFNLSLTLDGTNSIYLSVSSMEQMIHNYTDRSGQTALTLTVGATNLAKLSEEIKAVATAKNITLA